MTSEFKQCPICGAGLQATEVRETYFSESSFEIDSDYSLTEIHLGCCQGDNELDIPARVYCENDHSLYEMVEVLRREAVKP